MQFNVTEQNNYGVPVVAVKPGGLSPDDVTAWDGNFWQVNYLFTSDAPRFLRVYGVGGKVYVVGQFELIGGVAAQNIATWDDKTWNSLAPGRYPVSGIDGAVASLALDHDGNLIAGGGFQTAGGRLAANIARWDGSAWAQLADGLNGPVTALAVNRQGQVYAGGRFLLPDGRQVLSLARLDPGSGTWEYLWQWEYGGGSVAALAFAPDGTLYVAGFGEVGQKTGYYVAAWNGQGWRVLPGPFNQDIVTLLIDHQGSLYAGGAFSTAAGVPMNGLARWDGQTGQWVNLGVGLDVTSPASLVIKNLLERPDGDIIISGNFNGWMDSRFAILPACCQMPAREEAIGKSWLAAFPGQTRWFMARMAAFMWSHSRCGRTITMACNWRCFRLGERPGNCPAGSSRVRTDTFKRPPWHSMRRASWWLPGSSIKLAGCLPKTLPSLKWGENEKILGTQNSVDELPDPPCNHPCVPGPVLDVVTGHGSVCPQPAL